jgi:phosphate starvation-inducible PhoH-like protein
MDSKFCGSAIITDRNGRTIYEKTPGQHKLVETINSNDIIFVSGPSGTGKTAIATWVGINGVDDGKYERLILTRPVVAGGEELGFLPGSLNEKVAPYMQPLNDAIAMIKGYPGQDVEKTVVKHEPLTKKEKKTLRNNAKVLPKMANFYDRVRVCPLAFIRGSTLARSYIVCDEFQNVTASQMKMMITRLGRGSKMVICGDPRQCDLDPKKAQSGFSNAITLLKGVRGIGFVELGVEDIVRHPMMKEIILRYERPEYKMEHHGTEGEKEFNKFPAHTWERDAEGYDFSDDLSEDEQNGICTHCDGTGIDSFTGEACPICGGTGNTN